ncbi:MAG: hypothetical protein JRJ77_03660, partial [Deltaproteobacteria bacterium]|nr:hypothetical protein [Deltaproteobacteria bacterium]
MSIHSFGDYPEKFHPHIHAIVSDGLFARTGTFYVMPGVDLKPLEETGPPLLSRRRGRRVFRASYNLEFSRIQS